MQRVLPVLLLVLTSGCGDLFGPRLPRGAQPFAPPAVYARWWGMVEACSGRSGDLASVRWYAVPGAESLELRGERIGGYYDRAAHHVVLAGEMQLAAPLVRHEMLHALLREHRHPRGAFLGDCAGTVTCAGECVREAGPPPAPAPGAARVPPSTLVLGVTADPAQPSIAADGGLFIVTVTARNPAPTPVVVELPPSGDAGPSGGFSFMLEGTQGSVMRNARVADASVTQFEPGEVKRWVFDLRGGSRPEYGELAPDTYRVRGAYGTEWVTSPTTLVMRP
jgi:hypothetical protein